MSAPLIKFDHVSLAYGEPLALGDLSLSIARGEILCLAGPSGCGKTTALRVAVVLQDYAKAPPPWRTAEGNVSLALEAMGTPRREGPFRIAEMLARVGRKGRHHK